MASAKMLSYILIFKGMQEGHIAKWDFATYPCRCIYTGQISAWMDELVMLQSVEQVLKPQILDVRACFSSYALRFLQVPHHGFGL